MPQARSTLIPPGHAVYAHVVTRCVRRAWLLGKDRFSNRRFDHRCALVEGRIRMLAEIFGVGVYAFALMANHVHLVLVVLPDSIRQLSDDEIVERWLRLYPSRTEKRIEQRRAEILANPARIVELRDRLGSLSWFMKCLNEHIARVANKEDNAKGHFWEGRLPVTCEARHARHCRARQTRPSDVPQAPRGLVSEFKLARTSRYGCSTSERCWLPWRMSI